jgi:serine/threonine-protein kinase
MVMERLAGVTLGQRVDAGTLDRAEGLAVMRELCEIVGAAHAAGVVHRDIKLDNVFLEDGRRVRLLDWGVARVLAEPDPFRGMIAGTLTYVAPEQIVGEDISPAADVYSLGVLAYHVLLGRPPFSSPVDLDLIRKHVHEPAPRPETLWPEIPEDLARLLHAMLAKNPEQRPSLAEAQRVFAQPLDRVRAARTAVRWRRSMATAVVAGVIAMATAAAVIA